MTPPQDPEEHQFDEIGEPASPPGSHLDIDDLAKVRLEVSAELGRCELTVREVLQLERGSIVSLDKLAGELLDVYVNDIPLARGEVVPSGDALFVRVGEIVGATKDEDEEEVEEVHPSSNGPDFE
jgi:flagellar motor switch protein FliN/FliY